MPGVVGTRLAPMLERALIDLPVDQVVHLWLLVALVVADLVAGWLSLGLREVIGRARPPLVYREPEALVSVPHSGAFPSGHASAAFACAAVLAWASPRLAAPMFVLAAAIAWSRVYVGVHWPLDVLGGAVLGVLVSIGLLRLAATRRLLPRGMRAG